ncbi:MAG: hypothetical protein PHQ40_21920 [Anaerolineaceae bacterium]|nr:hypothetical protein [Anaerolineaceae bacterium]
MDDQNDCRVQESFDLAEEVGALGGGAFDVLAITTGEGNGWSFPEVVLRGSLDLWEGVETFVDHAGHGERGRSVRDLAGICSDPRWDAERQGVRVTLRTTGPSGPLVEALAREWLAGEEPRPRLGFSADVLFTAQGRQVTRILRVLSLDLVFNPARGGIFVRALNSASAQPYHPCVDQLRELEKEAVSMGAPQENVTLQTNPAPAEPEAGTQAVQACHVRACAYLLEAGLTAAHLPAGVTQRLRRQFAERVFEPTELETAIEDARSLMAELQGGSVIAGPGRISGMVTGEERLQAAVDDLLDAPRDEAMRSVKVERLGGLRELYVTLTGDVDLHGGYYPQHTSLATTITMPALVKNAMNKIIAEQWDQLGRAGYRWWEKVVRVEHFESLHDITGILVGEVGALPKVDEGAAYTELPIADSEELGKWDKYGGYLPLTMELVDRDQVGKLKSFPRRLGSAALRNLSRMVADVFMANAGLGPRMKDNGFIFRLAFNNLGSAALSPAAWEDACGKVFRQPLLVAAGESAPVLALDPKYLLVPRALRLAAMQLLYPQWERQANVFSENMQRGELGDVIVVPEFANATDWAAVVDPRLAPAIFVGERFGLVPEIFISGDPLSPAMFTNDETRLKVRHFVSVFVADHRPLYKANIVE